MGRLDGIFSRDDDILSQVLVDVALFRECVRFFRFALPSITDTLKKIARTRRILRQAYRRLPPRLLHGASRVVAAENRPKDLCCEDASRLPARAQGLTGEGAGPTRRFTL